MDLPVDPTQNEASPQELIQPCRPALLAGVSCKQPRSLSTSMTRISRVSSTSYPRSNFGEPLPNSDSPANPRSITIGSTASINSPPMTPSDEAITRVLREHTAQMSRQQLGTTTVSTSSAKCRKPDHKHNSHSPLTTGKRPSQRSNRGHSSSPFGLPTTVPQTRHYRQC